MKWNTYLLIIAFILLPMPPLGAQRKQELNPMVTVDVMVLDEAGQPLESVDVSLHFSLGGYQMDGAVPRGLTKPEGMVRLMRRGLAGAELLLKKQGYYAARVDRSTHPELDFQAYATAPNDKDPSSAQSVLKEKVSLKASVTLRKIGEPIPLFVKLVRAPIPEAKSWVGYDFEVGDWTAPHGQGKVVDIRVRSQSSMPRSESNAFQNPAVLEIDFGPGGGYVAVDAGHGYLPHSQLRVPSSAPLEGYSLNRYLTLTVAGQGEDGGSAPAYFFRTRVQRSGDTIVKAHYGKFSAGVTYSPWNEHSANHIREAGRLPTGAVEFTYYFNPNANDRNLAWEVGKNLYEHRREWGVQFWVDTP